MFTVNQLQSEKKNVVIPEAVKGNDGSKKLV